MARSNHLQPQERAFFGLLAETVYSNPFGSDRVRLSQLLGRDLSRRVVSQAGYYGELVPALDARLSALRERGLARLDQFHPEDRGLMRRIFLFRCYQESIPVFDGVIEHQTHQRQGAPDLAGVPGLVERLSGYGFDDAEQGRFIALYYQLRRAYHFIERALVGRSEPMRALRQCLWNSVFTTDLGSYALLLWGRMEDFSTFLLGETGTGKGSAAAAIGRSGAIPFDARTKTFARGFEQTFIATNLSEFSEGLIESELFGHRKGAFTGAVENHEGLFSRCPPHGTLFLDEIGDVSLPVQTKLLRVLQERTFNPVGSHQTQRFTGRVVAATNRTLDELLGSAASDGPLGAARFRVDLFYRLSGNIVRVPALRERLADSPDELGELVDVLLKRLAGDAAEALRDPVLEALAALPGDYPWPGNVRELEQALRRIILNGQYVPDALPRDQGTDPWLAAAQGGRLDAPGLIGGYCQRLLEQHGTIQAVSKAMGLDRRTVKKYIAASRWAEPLGWPSGEGNLGARPTRSELGEG